MLPTKYRAQIFRLAGAEFAEREPIPDSTNDVYIATDVEPLLKELKECEEARKAQFEMLVSIRKLADAATDTHRELNDPRPSGARGAVMVLLNRFEARGAALDRHQLLFLEVAGLLTLAIQQPVPNFREQAKALLEKIGDQVPSV